MRADRKLGSMRSAASKYGTASAKSLRAKYRNPSWKLASFASVESMATARVSWGTAFAESLFATYIVPTRKWSSAVMRVSAHWAYLS